MERGKGVQGVWKGAKGCRVCVEGKEGVWEAKRVCVEGYNKGVCGRGQRERGCAGGKEVCVEGGKEKEGVWKEAKRVLWKGVKRVCVWKMAWVRGGHEGVYGRGQSGRACGSGQSV